MPGLLKPLEFVRDARRILRMKDALPSARAIYHAWLALRRYRKAYRAQPLEIELGEYMLHGNTWQELSEVFEEVFVRSEYYSRMPMKDPVILDCGGNIGLASLYFKLHFPQARIQAFEPNPRSCEAFLKTVKVNDLEDVTLVQAACSNRKGKATFHMDPAFSPRSSLQDARGGKDSVPVEVELVKPSDYINRPVDMLKMDVEGAEWEILDDLTKSGKINLVDRMFIEYHHRIPDSDKQFGDFLNMLEKSGFTYALSTWVPARRRFCDVFQDIMVYAVKKGKEDEII